MFSLSLGNHHELRLLQISDADELFDLVDKNRSYLRTWLPWLDGTTVSSDTRDFIKLTLQQLADNRGFVAAICVEKSIAGVVGYNHIDSRAIPERLGFTHEGTCRDAEWLYDHFVNHEVYAQLRSDWNKRNA